MQNQKLLKLHFLLNLIQKLIYNKLGVSNVNGVEEQLQDISTSMENISSAVEELEENHDCGASLLGVGIVIIIVLICINNNIKKLTQAIRDKK